MTKSESKYFNTAQMMDKALIDLLSRKDIQYISVKEICEKAGVNRSTFYLHYETIADLLDETMQYIQEKFAQSFAIKAKDFIRQIDEMPLEKLVLIDSEFLRPYLTFIQENRQVYRASVRNSKSLKSGTQLSTMYETVLKPIFTRFGIPEKDQKYWLVYHVHGLTAIVAQWLEDDCTEPTEEIIQLMEECVRAGHGFIGKKYGEEE